jgi:malic enzyme
MRLSKIVIGGVAASAIAALTSVSALAQVDSRFVITGPAAARAGEMNMINAATARAIAGACERMAVERDLSNAIVILDNFGNVVHQRVESREFPKFGRPSHLGRRADHRLYRRRRHGAARGRRLDR